MDEESSEGTWSSSPEPNMEVIWPEEIMTFFSSQPKEMNLSHLESEMKFNEDDRTTKRETHRYLSKNTFEELEVAVRKEHAAKRQN
ncbi:hypothetical protein GQ457_15G021510 [Hibiscus cannabinus]